MIANPKIEISGMEPDGSWIRVVGKAVRDDRDEARAAFLAAHEDLKKMYHVGDGIFEVLYFEDVTCTKCSFTSAPVVIK